MSIRTEAMANYVFFTFSVTLTLTFDLDLPKTIGLFGFRFPTIWYSLIKMHCELRTVEWEQTDRLTNITNQHS